MQTISLDSLHAVTGGTCRGSSPVRPIPEDGGIAGPVGSPTPRFDVKPIPEDGGVVGPLGSPTPRFKVKPIPESGGIAGKVGSPTPF